MPWRKYATDWIAALTGSYISANSGDAGRETSGSERETRGGPRVPVRLWVGFPEEPNRGTVTTDLSLEGCCLEGDFRDRVGQRMTLYLDLYDNCDPLKLKAKVIWSDPDKAGFRFLNLHVADEVRLLKNLGKATAITPSNFLPSTLQLSCPYTYRVEASGDEASLFVSVTNWDVRFDFKETVTRGPNRGSFHRFQLFHSSGDIQRARSRRKVSLERQQQFIHLVLMDERNDVVFEIIGEEVGFERQQRPEVAYLGEEVA
jgi:PilZ domain-containing protein